MSLPGSSTTPLSLLDVPLSWLLMGMEGNNTCAKQKSTSIAATGKLVVMANAATQKARVVLGEIGNNQSANPQRIAIYIKEFMSDCQCTECPQDGVEDPQVVPRAGFFSSQNFMDSDDEPNLVSIYVKDIYYYLKVLELEEKYFIKANFMEACSDIRPGMRITLMNWLAEVHHNFHLAEETLYLAVPIIDQYIQAVPTVARSNYQLIGIAALLIAAKFEDSVSGMVPNLVYLMDSAYTIEDTLRTEIRILKTIEFNLGRPLPLYFLRNYSTAANFAHNNFYSVVYDTLAKYLLELSLIDYKFCQYLPSKLAAAALCLSLK